MPIRGGSGAGGLRGALVACGVIALAIAGSWLDPGPRLARARRHGASRRLRVQADSARRAPRRPSTAPPTVPGAQVQAPTGRRPRPVSLWSRLSGLLGLALILGIGVAALAQPERHPVAGGRVGAGPAGAVRHLRAPDSRRARRSSAGWARW